MNLIYPVFSILRLRNIQNRGQYENCDVIKEFTRTLRFEVSAYLKSLAIHVVFYWLSYKAD